MTAAAVLSLVFLVLLATLWIAQTQLRRRDFQRAQASLGEAMHARRDLAEAISELRVVLEQRSEQRLTRAFISYSKFEPTSQKPLGPLPADIQYVPGAMDTLSRSFYDGQWQADRSIEIRRSSVEHGDRIRPGGRARHRQHR